MNTRKLCTAATAVCLLFIITPGCTTTKKEPASKPVERPETAQEVLEPMQAMGAALSSAKSFSFSVQGYMDEALESGQLVQIYRGSKISVRRPDRLHLEIDGNDANWNIWYDGSNLTILDNALNEAATTKAPATLDEFLNNAINEHGFTVPMSDLIYKKPGKTLLANVQSSSYFGLHTVGEHKCHHLGFRQEMIDWQIWIDSGELPVPRKLVITYKNEPGLPQYVSIMDDWDLSATLPEKSFSAELPQDVKKMSMKEFLGLDEEETDNE